MAYKKSIWKLVVVLFLLTQTQSFGEADALNDASQLRIEVTTTERWYRVGDRITLTVDVRNVGGTAIWVSKPGFASNLPGSIRISVTDSEGKALPNRLIVLESFPASPKCSEAFEEFLKQHQVLPAGAFFGIEQTIEQFGFDSLPPGRYVLRATYSDEGISGPCKDAVLKRARIPVFSGELTSQGVEIQVRSRATEHR